MRIALLLCCAVGLCGCAKEASKDDAVVVPDLETIASPFDAIVRLPDRLLEGLRMRKSHVDHVAIEDVFASQFESGELVALLVRWQPYILNLMEAARRLEPPLPEEPVYTDDEITNNIHLDGITSRLINNSRLLVTDALRCWSVEDHHGCAARFDAGLRLGLCMYEDGDPQHRRNGTLLLQAVFVELQLRVNDGLADRIDAERTDAFLVTLHRFRDNYRAAGIESTTGTRIVAHLIEVFSQEGE